VWGSTARPAQDAGLVDQDVPLGDPNGVDVWRAGRNFINAYQFADAEVGTSEADAEASGPSEVAIIEFVAAVNTLYRSKGSQTIFIPVSFRRVGSVRRRQQQKGRSRAPRRAPVRRAAASAASGDGDGDGEPPPEPELPTARLGAAAPVIADAPPERSGSRLDAVATILLRAFACARKAGFS
jgi:hypothetical protein